MPCCCADVCLARHETTKQQAGRFITCATFGSLVVSSLQGCPCLVRLTGSGLGPDLQTRRATHIDPRLMNLVLTTRGAVGANMGHPQTNINWFANPGFSLGRCYLTSPTLLTWDSQLGLGDARVTRYWARPSQSSRVSHGASLPQLAAPENHGTSIVREGTPRTSPCFVSVHLKRSKSTPHFERRDDSGTTSRAGRAQPGCKSWSKSPGALESWTSEARTLDRVLPTGAGSKWSNCLR